MFTTALFTIAKLGDPTKGANLVDYDTSVHGFIWQPLKMKNF